MTEERDRLLTEKSNWSSAAPAGSTDLAEARRQWEAEKAQLVKARDESVAAVAAAEQKLKDVEILKKNHVSISHIQLSLN